MKSRQILFYGSDIDILEIVSTVEDEIELKYYLYGLLNESDIQSIESLRTVKVGQCNCVDTNLCISYLALLRKDQIQIETINQRKGGVKFGIDQKLNPSSVHLRPCGRFEEGNAIIQGRIDTINDHPDSIKIFSVFSTILFLVFSWHN